MDNLLGSVRSMIVAVTLIIVTAGCQTHYTKDFEQGDTNYGSRTGQEENAKDTDRLYGTHLYGGNGHRNQSLTYNNKMSLDVSEMPGVFSAVVMTTDQNAYAAVILDSSGTGITGKGDRIKGDFIGTTRGSYHWPSGSQYADPNEITTGSNSYFTVKDHRNLSDLFKKRVAVKIRNHNPSLAEVHISANKDFINQMSVFREEARRGNNLNDYLEQFNQLVADHFGENANIK